MQLYTKIQCTPVVMNTPFAVSHVRSSSHSAQSCLPSLALPTFFFQ